MSLLFSTGAEGNSLAGPLSYIRPRGEAMSGQVTAIRVRVTKGRLNTGNREIVLTGRLAWAMGRLIESGTKGCTALDQPGPRWSSYIHKLRGFGFDVETIHVPHSGAYAGTHARYVLTSNIEIISDERAVA